MQGKPTDPLPFNEELTYEIVTDSPGQGWMDYTSRELHISASVQQEGVRLTLSLVAAWYNLPLLVRLPAESRVVECDAPSCPNGGLTNSSQCNLLATAGN